MENILDLTQSHLDHLDTPYVKSQIIKKEKEKLKSKDRNSTIYQRDFKKEYTNLKDDFCIKQESSFFILI